jgi:hypothetical protein
MGSGSTVGLRLARVHNDEKRAFGRLTQTSNVGEATGVFPEAYERAEAPHLDKKITYARQVLEAQQ